MRIAWSWPVAAVLVPLLVWAAPNPSQGSEPAAQQPEPVVFSWKPGPRKVELGHELTLDLPADHVFLEKAEATKLMEMNGSFYNDNLPRYADFQEGTDKVAEFGLAGLVLGGAGMGAAKLAKVGILAKLEKFFVAILLAGKKLIIPLLIALGALFSKLFGGKKTEGAAPPSNPGE
jgi:uncharacterized membrane-anchored protein